MLTESGVQIVGQTSLLFYPSLLQVENIQPFWHPLYYLNGTGVFSIKWPAGQRGDIYLYLIEKLFRSLSKNNNSI